MIATIRLSLAALCLVAVSLSAEAKLYSVAKVTVIQNKMLEFHELGKYSSGISSEEIEAALNEYNEWPTNYVEMSKAKPSLRLALDFVVLPYEWARQHGIITDESTFRKFLKRSEAAYKEMWPSYHGRIELDGKMCKSFKFNKLRSFIEGNRPMAKLTVQDFADVQSEVRQWEARWQEMTEYEDIFACKTELETILNYVLNNCIMALKTAVFPLLKSEKDPQKLMGLWRREMWEKYGLACVNGNWQSFTKFGKDVPMPGAPAA